MIGRTLSHYRIERKIGAGGMGEVYLTRDTRLGREVAIKMLPPDVATSEEQRQRFLHEARTLAALNHPHIVVIYSLEEHEGARFLCMELVRGKVLDQPALAARRVPLHRTWRAHRLALPEFAAGALQEEFRSQVARVMAARPRAAVFLMDVRATHATRVAR